MYTRLNFLDESVWKDISDIIIIGCGRQGKKMIETFSKDFTVVAVADNNINKQGDMFEGYVVYSIDEALAMHENSKVIVTTSQYYYQDIKKQLIEKGLVEFVDFVMYQQFITEWYYKNKNKINILKTDLSITSKCTLRCEHCMQFLPFWKSERRKAIDIDELIKNLDLYFECVDFVFDFDLIGGEPFLYNKLDELLTYIGETYRKRVGYLGIITNGTIVPKDSTLELISKYDIDVSISDYSQCLEYQHKIPDILKKFENYGVHFMVNSEMDWFDFGFPRDKYAYEGEEAVMHMQNCNSITHVLDENKLFYCGQEWAAYKGGLFPLETKAYVDLEYMINNKSERYKILEMMLGNIDGGCLDFCKVCGGFGIDNDNRVETAKQLQ